MTEKCSFNARDGFSPEETPAVGYRMTAAISARPTQSREAKSRRVPTLWSLLDPLSLRSIFPSAFVLLLVSLFLLSNLIVTPNFSVLIYFYVWVFGCLFSTLCCSVNSGEREGERETVMGCFRCTGKSSAKSEDENDNYSSRKNGPGDQTTSDALKVNPNENVKDSPVKEIISKEDQLTLDLRGLNLKDEDSKRAQTFTFEELAEATGNFRSDCFLGEGGFGKVFKGHLAKINQDVAIKQLDRNGCQGIREFVVEVVTLSLADHPNLVKLIGFCAEGDQRLLVYEYMPLGSLENHLHDLPPDSKVLDWNTRMRIAAGAARGLEYLHDKMKPPVIYRDLKCSNILLGEGYHPKLSDFGLAKVGPSGDKTHVSTRVMGTYGYCAPDYAMTGQLTFKSDIYSFGVVLLELITGRKAIDNTKTHREQNLVAWARPLFKDRKKFSQMADPLLRGQYPVRGLYQALAIAAMCVQEQPNMRPIIADVVTALNYLATQKYDPQNHPAQHSRRSPPSPKARRDDGRRQSAGNGLDRGTDFED